MEPCASSITPKEVSTRILHHLGNGYRLIESPIAMNKVANIYTAIPHVARHLSASLSGYYAWSLAYFIHYIIISSIHPLYRSYQRQHTKGRSCKYLQSSWWWQLWFQSNCFWNTWIRRHVQSRETHDASTFQPKSWRDVFKVPCQSRSHQQYSKSGIIWMVLLSRMSSNCSWCIQDASSIL